VAWQDRVREAAYTSPLGGRFTFLFEDVSVSAKKRTAEFEFANVEGSYIQDNKHSGRRYPLRIYFSGANYDLEAETFFEALLEQGAGRLEHPMYGTKDVVPFGEITRRDDLVSGANQAVFEVLFVNTLLALYPNPQSDPSSDLVALLALFDTAASEQFAEQTDLAGAIEQANEKATVRTLLGTVSAALEIVAAATADVRREFGDAVAAVNLGIDVLIGQPVLLVQQIVNLTRAPARAEAGIRSRIEGYRRLLDRILASAAADGSLDDTALAGIKLRITNDFHTADLFAMSAVTGSILSVLETTFSTKPEAIAAALEVNEQLDALVTWRDGRLATLGELDPGGAYQALQSAVALVTGYLIQISFTLIVERRVVLDRERTIIDLAAELYGTVDDKLDFLISSNDLSGAELLELPRGRMIKYYDG
jgi:hypothetical protein